MYDIFNKLVAASLQNCNDDDYIDEEGFLVCGKCHTRKQQDITIPTFGNQPERIIRVLLITITFQVFRIDILLQKGVEKEWQYLQVLPCRIG